MTNIKLNKKRVIDAELIRRILSSAVKPNEIISLDRLRGYLCAYLNISIEEVDKLLIPICKEDYLSLDNYTLLYPIILKLSINDTNRYFINKLAKDKKIVTKKDVIECLRCLPLEKRIDCINHLDYYFNGQDSMELSNPQALYIKIDQKELKKDMRYVAEDNLKEYISKNKYVFYSEEHKNNIKKNICSFGVGFLCTGAISVLSLSLGNTLYAMKNNNSSIVMEQNDLNNSSDELILQWLEEAMANHNELVNNSEIAFIKNTYNEEIRRQYQNIIHSYYEYIRVTDPEYYYREVMNPEDASEILSLESALGTPIVPQDGKREHEIFINNVKIFNDTLINEQDHFENYQISISEDISKSLTLK